MTGTCCAVFWKSFHVTTPGDPNEGARMRAHAFLRAGEERIRRSWFRSLTRWLDRVRPQVVSGGELRPQNVGQNAAFWGQLMDSEVVPESASLYRRVRNRIVQRDEPVTDPESAAFLNDVGNRLKRIPDEVYALIVREIETGIALGESNQVMARRVSTVLTATGSERWPSRAIVVARTGSLAAVNAGAYTGAIRDAELRGDPAPFKVWLATSDQRTRPTHRAADGQRTLLTEPFRVGGAQLRFPGDPRGPAQEVIQCRCTLLPVTLGETIDWTDRQDP
jgi:Phage Mu protein F like protein